MDVCIGECTPGQGEMFGEGCPGDPDQTIRPNPTAEFNLPGPQVDPTAAYWTLGMIPALVRVVPVVQVINLIRSDPRFEVPRYPVDPAALDWELGELAHLEAIRDDASQVAGSYAVAPPSGLDPIYTTTTRLDLSKFLQLRPPPFGTIFNINGIEQPPIDNVNQQHLRIDDPPPVVTTGRQLARMFQDETPGLLHRHALDYLLYKRVFEGDAITPPRQARIWMALDVTIYSALVAAWYFKWAHPDFTTVGGTRTFIYSYRQRPYEYDRNRRFRVLYDDFVDDCGEVNKCARDTPCPSPGTPRHPAFPSGHSTYSAAASEILSYFFPSERSEFEKLADNIGTARLWGGVHWRSDHIAGQRIGRAVAELVRRQLEQDCVPPFDDPLLGDDPNVTPTLARLRQIADYRNNPCTQGQDELPGQRTSPFRECEPADRKDRRAL